jgi:hypothetical protein
MAVKLRFLRANGSNPNLRNLMRPARIVARET